MERYRYSEQSWTSFEAVYRPPLGIDAKPFQTVKISDFIIKRPDNQFGLKNSYFFPSCVQAVWQVRDGVNNLPQEKQNAIFQVHRTQEQNQRHLHRYLAVTLTAIKTLSDEVDEVLVAAPPVGGISLLHAVMRESIKDPVSSNHRFAPLIDDASIYDYLRPGRASVFIDDGLTLPESLGRFLEIRENDAGDSLVEEMRAVQKIYGACMADEFKPLYQSLVVRLHKAGIVVAPLFAKNQLLMNLLHEQVESYDDVWTRAQKQILSQGAVMLLDEHVQSVGAMIDHLPLRDFGVRLADIDKMGIAVEPAVREKLETAGLDKATFRLLANEPRLLTLNGGSREIVGLFVELLKENLLA